MLIKENNQDIFIKKKMLRVKWRDQNKQYCKLTDVVLRIEIVHHISTVWFICECESI